VDPATAAIVKALVLYAFEHITSIEGGIEAFGEWREWGCLVPEDWGAWDQATPTPGVVMMLVMDPEVTQRLSGCSVAVPVLFTEHRSWSGGDCPPYLVGWEFYDAAGRLFLGREGENLPAGKYYVPHWVVGFTSNGIAIVYDGHAEHIGTALWKRSGNMPIEDMDALAEALEGGYLEGEGGYLDPDPCPEGYYRDRYGRCAQRWRGMKPRDAVSPAQALGLALALFSMVRGK
jgi:hypothetical protein